MSPNLLQLVFGAKKRKGSVLFGRKKVTSVKFVLKGGSLAIGLREVELGAKRRAKRRAK